MLKICSINIKSLAPKIDLIRQMMYEEEVDIINIQETWIKEEKYLPGVKGYI